VKKLAAVLLGGALLIGSLPSVSAADLPDEQWTPIQYPQGDGWRSLYMGDNTTLNREPSAMFAETPHSDGTPAPAFHCENVTSPKCKELTQIDASAFLQPCSIEITTNCIESVYAIGSDGNRVDGIDPTRYPTTGRWEFAANNAINLPAGGAPTIWNIPGITHGGGTNQYMVQAFTNSFLQKAADTDVTNEQFVLTGLTVNLVPVKIISGRYLQQVSQDSTETNTGTPKGVGHPSQDEWRYCAMIDNGSCAQRQAFPADVKFGVKLRLQHKITGWLHGRIFNPDANISLNTFGEQIIEVSALPIKVPVIGEWFKWDQLSPAIQQYVLDGKMTGGQGFFATKNLPSGNFQEIMDVTGQRAFDALSLWLPQVMDKASANPSTWTFYNLKDWELQGADRCIRDATDLVGFVTTNATAYSAGTPSFNEGTQSLDYKVMSPHYTSKGEVARGTYDLRIRSEVARCIYGFTSAPIQASISILSEDGSAQTATQTINEKDGWLSLSANGFTYSSPTIAVKLSQVAPAPEVVVVPPKATSTPTPKAKTTITCVKGKTAKKIVAVNPKCPTGYKKK
jgi:hypothetical protein